MTFLLNRVITVYHFVRKTERGNEKRITSPSPPPLPAAVIESLKSRIEIDGRIESIKKDCWSNRMGSRRRKGQRSTPPRERRWT
jgi:hypothetical protein